MTSVSAAASSVPDRCGKVSPETLSAECFKKRTNVVFFGHFAGFNWGNDSTLLAMLHYVRSHLPEAEMGCVCDNPDAASAVFAIPSVPISKAVVNPWNPRNPLARIIRKLFIGVPREFWRWVRAFQTLKGARLLIVPGTGLLTDVYGLGNWGPYSLLKWCVAAKLRRCKVAFVSVGAGPIYGARGRSLVKAALALADYRSYRDQSSKDYLDGIGLKTGNDAVYPDLAFSLPETLVPLDDKAKGERVVGLGLMEYAGRYSVADPSEATYPAYLETMGQLVQWLLARDYGVRLLTGDVWDRPVIERFKAMLEQRLNTQARNRIEMEAPASAEQLLSNIAGTDVVVATRFHNVLLALLLGKPVIAITFHDKCTSLMQQMGLSEYCHDIHQLDSGKLIEQFQRLIANADEVRERIRRKVLEARKALDEQYQIIFEAM